VGQIFISHVEENADVALGIADGLEEAGYGTWCYERDALPGPSYLLQTARQIESSAAVVLLISADSLGSHQVTAEVVRAHESAKPFVPVLIGISHVEFAARQPEWREALGSSTSIALPPGGVAPLLPRVLDGLRGLGIAPSDGDDGTAPAAVPHVYRVPASAPAPPMAPQASMARRPLLVGAGVAVAALLLLAVGVVAIGGGGGGGGDDAQRAQDASARTPASTVAEPSGASGGERASGSEEQTQQFASATNTPLATSAGSLRVASSVLTTRRTSRRSRSAAGSRPATSASPSTSGPTRSRSSTACCRRARPTTRCCSIGRPTNRCCSPSRPDRHGTTTTRPPGRRRGVRAHAAFFVAWPPRTAAVRRRFPASLSPP